MCGFLNPRGHPLRAERELGVGGVVEHLGDHLAPPAGVRGALDLHQGWDALAIDIEVVEAPTATGVLLITDRRLSTHEQQRALAAGLVSEHFGVLCDQRLQDSSASKGVSLIDTYFSPCLR